MVPGIVNRYRVLFESLVPRRDIEYTTLQDETTAPCSVRVVYGQHPTESIGPCRQESTIKAIQRHDNVETAIGQFIHSFARPHVQP